MPLSLIAATLALPATAARADEVTDTLNAARAAYEAGDIAAATEEVAFASQLLQAMKVEGLAAFLPAAPEGWTREIDTEMNAGLAMMGGGAGAAARYDNGTDSFTITLMADNPMVAAMSGMLGGAMMGAMGKITRIGREKFVQQDGGDLVALVGNRVLVQAEGADLEVMRPVLAAIDFPTLADWGR
ncbi:hypothetical protein [Phaeovulum vinaykumarii]|uniref:hypothetical protein n=1 Tax=Phaeovulum vinaykumarii TaxID=407234 RepID=UPI000BE23F36|nr:hypothetical protein [Phaeovulum vinaykumarii]